MAGLRGCVVVLPGQTFSLFCQNGVKMIDVYCVEDLGIILVVAHAHPSHPKKARGHVGMRWGTRNASQSLNLLGGVENYARCREI